MSDLEEILRALYDSEINASISWLWDGGIDVQLGDELNGCKAEGKVSIAGAQVALAPAAQRSVLSNDHPNRPWPTRHRRLTICARTLPTIAGATRLTGRWRPSFRMAKSADIA